jgi:hypothetical protein
MRPSIMRVFFTQDAASSARRNATHRQNLVLREFRAAKVVEPISVSKVRLWSRRNTPGLRALALAVVLSSLQLACKSDRVASGNGSSPLPGQAVPQSAMRAGRTGIIGVACPAFGSYAVPSSRPETGHKVILSWKRGSRPDSKRGAPVGYCIYRGTEPNRIDERLNVLPLAGARCADDSVEDGRKYYYGIRAITAEGVTSSTSRLASVSVPVLPRTSAAVMPDSPPLCRESP